MRQTTIRDYQIWAFMTFLSLALWACTPVQDWVLTELVTQNIETRTWSNTTEVRNCNAPENKTVECSAGSSRDFSFSAGGGAGISNPQSGVGVTFEAGVAEQLGLNITEGETLALDAPPKGAIYVYTISRSVNVISGQVKGVKENQEQVMFYTFNASCSLAIQSYDSRSCDPVITATSTSGPTSTSTFRPTATKTVQPSATSKPLTIMYDDFNDAFYENGLNRNLWSFWSQNQQGFQQLSGVLNINSSKPTGMIPLKYEGENLQTFRFYEAQLFLTRATRGALGLKIHVDLPNGQQIGAQCGIYMDSIASDPTLFCDQSIDKTRPTYPFFKNIKAETWHTFRIEYRPDNTTVSLFVDGEEVGSYQNQELDSGKFLMVIGSSSEEGEPLIGKVDNVKIGPVP